MKRRSAVFVLAAILAGCGDSQSSTAPAVSAGPPISSASQTLRGTVILDPTHRVLPALDLLLPDGGLIGLDGDAALPLASVIGAEVEVVATASGDSMVEVQRFVVVSVDGQSVSDGILELNEDGAYTIRLTSGGTRDVVDPPEGLIEHVGERVWLAAEDGATPQAFGVIRP